MRPMAKRTKQDEGQAEGKPEVNTSQLERLAGMAAAATQAKQWRARKNGMSDQGEPSEVRDLSHDAEAKARAEAAMREMMAKGGGKRRGR